MFLAFPLGGAERVRSLPFSSFSRCKDNLTDVDTKLFFLLASLVGHIVYPGQNDGIDRVHSRTCGRLIRTGALVNFPNSLSTYIILYLGNEVFVKIFFSRPLSGDWDGMNIQRIRF